MSYSREMEPREPRNLRMIVSDVAPSGRDRVATERRVSLILPRYDYKLNSSSNIRRPEQLSSLLTSGYLGVQEFALLVQKNTYQLEAFKKRDDDSVLRSIFRGTLQSAMEEADAALQRIGGSPLNTEAREQWGKRKATLNNILNELPEPPKD